MMNARLPRLAALLLVLPLVAAEGQPEAPVPGHPLIDLEFAGGTAAEYAGAVRRAAGEANIVVAPEAAEVEMPAVSLRRVTVAAALNLLRDRIHAHGARTVRLEVDAMATFNPQERPTYRVAAHVRGPKPQRMVNVWTVANLLGDEYTADGILSALEMALQLVRSDVEMDVRFHEDTRLIVAWGDMEQLGAIDRVLDRVKEAVDERRGDATRQLSGTEAKLRDAEAALESLRLQNARLEVKLDEQRRMLEARDRELATLTAQLNAARSMIQQERARSGSSTGD